MAMFNSFLYVYQRVNIHFPMGFPMVFPLKPTFSYGFQRVPLYHIPLHASANSSSKALSGAVSTGTSNLGCHGDLLGVHLGYPQRTDTICLVYWVNDHEMTIYSGFTNKTRWSPRTRMLTRMLMAQMSKQMVMRSRTISFGNSLYLNSLVHVSLVTSLQYGVESVECGVWSVKWRKECGV